MRESILKPGLMIFICALAAIIGAGCGGGGGGGGGGGDNSPVLNYDSATGSLNVPGGEILWHGDLYNEKAVINTPSLAAIRVNGKVYLWFTEMGNTRLSDAKSREALIRKVFYIEGQQAAAQAFMITRSAMTAPSPISETTYESGVTLEVFENNGYRIKNQLHRPVIMKTDLGLNISNPILIEAKKTFDFDIGSLLTNWGETKDKIFLYPPEAIFGVITVTSGNELHVYGSIARIGFLPAAYLAKTVISYDDVRAGLNYDPNLFPLVNFVDTVDISVSIFKDVLGLVPGVGCMADTWVALTIDPLWVISRDALIDSSSMDVVQEIANNLAVGFANSAAECGCEVVSLGICEIAREIKNIIGTILDCSDVVWGAGESFFAKPYEVIPTNCTRAYQDNDGDKFGKDVGAICGELPPGWAATGNDCDDANGNIFPGATEVCDGIDNECPGDPGYGINDDNCLNCMDKDGDKTYSNAGCGSLVDCNDSNPEVFPGASETCNDRIDNQCPGDSGYLLIDEGCPTGDFAAMVSSGSGHTCSIDLAGGIKCWGKNIWGQLGDGTTIDRPLPAYVSGLSSRAISVSAGWYHNCALTSGFVAKCWGWNEYGQLGEGTTAFSPVPVNVSGLSSGVSAISAGYYHNCAIASGGAVKCWGQNAYGQLGNGSTADSAFPVNVSGLHGTATDLEAGICLSCALTLIDGVKCWGCNDYGQLGNGVSGPGQYSSLPVSVVGLPSDITAISVKGDHVVALSSSGAVWSWGRNDYGQLGNGVSGAGEYSNLPVPVIGLSSGVVEISAGSNHTCVLMDNQEIKCWGRNKFGQLGDGTFNSSSYPVLVPGLSGAGSIAAGDDQSCVVGSDGAVTCWGAGGSGQLGNGATADSANPVEAIGFGDNPGSCGDLVCNPYQGEFETSCPQDCVIVCGDSICNTLAGENAQACPQDCPGSCGDAVCNGYAGENEVNCVADCPASCGDAYCSPLQEGLYTCPQDCPGSCGDSYCNVFHEDPLVCPQECLGICGDYVCNSYNGEDEDNCVSDCPAVCGDGYCNPLQEDVFYCGQDCPGTCGDGICNIYIGERTACQQDCSYICGNQSATTGPYLPGAFFWGDANNGVIDAADVAVLNLALAGDESGYGALGPYNRCRFSLWQDLDGNGILTEYDRDILNNWLAGDFSDRTGNPAYLDAGYPYYTVAAGDSVEIQALAEVYSGMPRQGWGVVFEIVGGTCAGADLYGRYVYDGSAYNYASANGLDMVFEYTGITLYDGLAWVRVLAPLSCTPGQTIEIEAYIPADAEFSISGARHPYRLTAYNYSQGAGTIERIIITVAGQ